MSSRRKPSARTSQLAFEALSIEGGLLSPEWLARLAQLEAGQQADAEYRVPRGLNLRDEIGRFWRIAQAHWSDFDQGHARHAEPVALSERFVTSLFKDVFGFGSLKPSEPLEREGRLFPVTSFALVTRVPVVIAAADSGLDAPSPRFGEGGRKRSAFGLAQEFLNATDEALWGIACDGVTLRILRDNASLTRPAWVEADLGRIFAEERYADFAALWLLVHETRFGNGEAAPTDCPLETWRAAGREEGTRARDHLRRGVEDALLAFGQGFITHPDNAALRASIEAGTLTRMAFYQELLRLAYRLIFLLTAEERAVLHAPDASVAARTLYEQGYSLRRLRERSVRRSAHDRFSDLWEGLKIVFRGAARGEPALALPALGGLFSAGQCPSLDGARLSNSHLLLGVFKLSWLVEANGLSRVNWRDMGPEELGSVYESLLELVPQVSLEGRRFSFATGVETKGNARKTSGSYYTPDSLVQVLLEGALEPVVKDTIIANPGDTVEALLSLSVVDPACGSGHFLLAAARRLAVHVARAQANGTPSAAGYRHALRQVVGRCIYGVDLNPMAVELCKVSLWMEAVEPGLPLSFLDSHVQHGNALLGTTPKLMAKGIPDAAWEPIEGDDKKVASALKKRNKHSKSGQLEMLTGWADPTKAYSEFARAVEAVDRSDDDDLGAISAKAKTWGDILLSASYQRHKFIADAWCAAFVWPKPAMPEAPAGIKTNPFVEAAPTNEHWYPIYAGQREASEMMTKTTIELAQQYHFFHWHLMFPQVFQRGGFDVVLGNPPWDSLRFNEEEFFAERQADIAAAATASARKKLIAKLETGNPALFAKYRRDLREVDGVNSFVRSGVPYPLCGVGRVNLFALFAEAARLLVNNSGRVGQILPSGIVSDDSTKLFFQAVVESRQLVSFFDFENREALFAAVHRSFKFGIFTLASVREVSANAEFVFFATRVEHLKERHRQFSLSSDDIVLLNPATKTCPIFRSGRDAEITKAIYRRVPVLMASGWRVDQRRLINQSDDSGNFLSEPGEGRLPLYEGKFFHHYDHRWVTNDNDVDRSLTTAERKDPSYFLRPRHWYPTHDVQTRFGGTWKRPWVLAWRDIARSTDERTLIAAVLPSLAVPNTARVIFIDNTQLAAMPALIANLGALALDFVARQKIGGTHMSGFIVDQLPLLAPGTYDSPTPWSGHSLKDWLAARVLELTYTAWDLEPFARDVGYDGPPFRWDPERRAMLRAEIDSAFFHLYGLSRADTDYILDTFPIVRRNDEKAHGEYRTKRYILEVYDALAEATLTGQPYVSRLGPPTTHRPKEEQQVLPSVPVALPEFIAGDDVVRWIYAVLQAHGGKIRRLDLACAFSLRSEPAYLLKHSSDGERAAALKWSRLISGRSVAAGTLITALRSLEEHGAVRFFDLDSTSWVGVTERTPATSALDAWSVFEARLTLAVLKHLPPLEATDLAEKVALADVRFLQESVA